MAKVFEIAFAIGGKLSGSLKSALSGASGQLDAVGRKLREIERAQGDAAGLKKSAASWRQSATAYAEVQAKLRAMQQAMQQAGGATKAMQREFDAAKNRAGQLKERVAQQREEFLRLKSAVTAAGGSIRNLTQYQANLARQGDAARRSQERLQSIIARQASNRAARERMLGNVMSGPVGGGLAAAGSAMAASNLMGPGVNMQHIIAQGRVVGDMSPEQGAQAEAAIRSAARSGNTDALKTAEAWKTLLAGGMDAAKAMAIMGDISKTTTATGAEINDVALAANTLGTNLKITAEETKKAFEIMHFAGKEGMFEFKDMSKEFPKLTGHLRLLGIEGNRGVANLSAMLQIARKVTGTSEAAATNTENFLNKMTSPETVKKFAENYGINVEKAIKGAMARGEDPVIFMLEMIKRVTGGDKFRIGELFQDQQVGNFLAAAIPELDAIKSLSDRALQASGVIDKDFNVMMETAKEKMTALKVSTVDLGMSISNSLTPALNTIAGALKPVIDYAGDLAKRFPNVTAGAVMLAGAVVGVGSALSVLGLAINLGMGAWLGLSKALILVEGAMLGVNLAFLANPITWVVLGAVALGAAAWWVISNWETVKAWWGQFVTYMGAQWEQIIAPFRTMWQQVFDYLASIDLAEIGSKIIDTMIIGIKNKASGIKNAIKGAFGMADDVIPHSDAKEGPFSRLTAAGAAIINTMAGGVRGAQGGLAGAMAGAFGQAGIDAGGIGVPSGGGTAGAGGVVVNFSPQITVNGAANGADALGATLRDAEDSLRKMIERVLADTRRTSYA